MWKSSIAAAAVVTLLMVPAAAFTLTNDDEETYSVELILGEGDALVETFDLMGGETASDVCMTGCTIRLSSGAESYFEGDMSVVIRGGDFEIDSEDVIDE